MAEDPFVAAQAEIETALQHTRSLEASYVRIRALSATSNSPELQQAQQELEQALTDLGADLQDLIDSVQAVELDPFQYGLDVDDVAQRRQLVQRVGQEIESMRQEIMRKTPRPTSPRIRIQDDDDMLYEQQQQVEMLRDQDEQLDQVFRTVGNLRDQAHSMIREVEEQADILADADRIADRVGGKLQQGMRRVGTVLRANEDSWSSCCIGVLILVLVLLLLLVIIL